MSRRKRNCLLQCPLSCLFHPIIASFSGDDFSATVLQAGETQRFGDSKPEVGQTFNGTCSCTQRHAATWQWKRCNILLRTPRPSPLPDPRQKLVATLQHLSLDQFPTSFEKSIGPKDASRQDALHNVLRSHLHRRPAMRSLQSRSFELHTQQPLGLKRARHTVLQTDHGWERRLDVGISYSGAA